MISISVFSFAAGVWFDQKTAFTFGLPVSVLQKVDNVGLAQTEDLRIQILESANFFLVNGGRSVVVSGQILPPSESVGYTGADIVCAVGRKGVIAVYGQQRGDKLYSTYGDSIYATRNGGQNWERRTAKLLVGLNKKTCVFDTDPPL